MTGEKSKSGALKILERLYILEVLKGLAITGWHFFRNLFIHTLQVIGLMKKREAAVTIKYPEQRRPVAKGYRSRHRLLRRPDGSPKCVACMLCATICPAECIHIRAGESPNPRIEKYAVEFDVVLDRCVMCGFCEEACPVDAIRMDTGIIEMAAYDRKDFLDRRDFLMGQKPGPNEETDD
jgi:NADH-quinone oxidoreductase subunit I